MRERPAVSRDAHTAGLNVDVLETDDLERDHTAIAAKGVEFVRPPAIADQGKAAVFLELYGNKSDLIEFSQLRWRSPRCPAGVRIWTPDRVAYAAGTPSLIASSRSVVPLAQPWRYPWRGRSRISGRGPSPASMRAASVAFQMRSLYYFVESDA